MIHEHYLAHLFWNPPFCASTVSWCRRCRIHCYVAAQKLLLIESDEWFSPFSLSEPLAERRALERRAKREIQKMNAWASAIQGKKLSGERIANLEKMSECPALYIGSFLWKSLLHSLYCADGRANFLAKNFFKMFYLGFYACFFLPVTLV